MFTIPVFDSSNGLGPNAWARARSQEMVLEKIYVGLAMANKWTDPTSLLIIFLAGGIPALAVTEVAIALRFGIAYAAIIPLVLTVWYKFIFLQTPAADCEAFLTFKARRRPAARAPAAVLRTSARMPRPAAP